MRNPIATPDQQLHETLAAYGLDTAQLRTLITEGADIRRALSGDTIPEALDHVLTLLQAIVLPDERTQIRSHIDAAAFFMTTLGHHVQEQFWVICLDTKNRIQHAQMIYTGTIDSIHMRACEVFRPAIQHNSAAIIVAHNHPSADPSPSPEDVLMTAQLYAAGELLAIDLLDHLIIGQGRWQSLRERGLGFPNKA